MKIRKTAMQNNNEGISYSHKDLNTKWEEHLWLTDVGFNLRVELTNGDVSLVWMDVGGTTVRLPSDPTLIKYLERMSEVTQAAVELLKDDLTL